MARSRSSIVAGLLASALTAAGCGGNEPAVTDEQLRQFFAAYTDAESDCIAEAEPEFVGRVRELLATGDDPALQEWFYEGIFDGENACS